MSHCSNYQEHDPITSSKMAANPWIAIDEAFYEDSDEV